MRDSEEPDPEEPEEVDKEALRDKIAEAKMYIEEEYTEASWEALQTALQVAEAVVANEDATQEDIEEAYTNLVNAIKGLEPVEEEPEPEEVDKSELEAKIEEVADLNEQEYTEGSWANLQTALQAAISVFENDDATQAEVDEALDNLIAAIDGLKPVEEESEPELVEAKFYPLIPFDPDTGEPIIIGAGQLRIRVENLEDAHSYVVKFFTTPGEDGSKEELTSKEEPMNLPALMVWNGEDPLVIIIYNEAGDVIHTFTGVIPTV